MTSVAFADTTTLSLETAKNFAKEQELEKAFRSYLAFLKEVPRSSVTLPMTEEEKDLYERALLLYLKQDLRDYQEIIKRYSSSIEENPSFYRLRFIVAAALANTGDIPTFFDQFFLAFQQDQEHYLAHKIQSGIAIRLWERISVGSEKDELQQMILFHLFKAQEKEPQDFTIYRMIFRFFPQDKRAFYTEEVLDKILRQSIMVPRIDIPFYVKAALDVNKKALAQKFLDQAKIWYPTSRMIIALQKTLNSQD